jgi:PadR family transcriptional regulator, regulatory protein PadR
MHRRRRFGPRHRRRTEDGDWVVRARIERFGEVALLLLLAERETHGYELLERLPELLGEERVDVGNVYRVLRGLEEEGVVASEWRPDLPGPAKRTYRLTDDGRELIEAWLRALRELQGELDRLEDRTRTKGGAHVRS